MAEYEQDPLPLGDDREFERLEAQARRQRERLTQPLRRLQDRLAGQVDVDDTLWLPARPPPGAEWKEYPPVVELRRRRGTLSAEEREVLNACEWRLAELGGPGEVPDHSTADAVATCRVFAFRGPNGRVDSVGFAVATPPPF